MNATLNLYNLCLAFGDAANSSNPALKYVDWNRNQQGLAVSNPLSRGYTIPAGQEVTILDGSRALDLDGTTELDLALSPLNPSRYRMTYSGGTDPGFRVDRGVDTTGIELTLVASVNGVLQVTAGTGTPFSAVQVGDHVFVPGTSTGDAAGPFTATNEGLWSVLAASSTVLQLVRPTGVDFDGASESVTPAASGDLLVYSSAGVQEDDEMDVSAGFASTAQKTYNLVAVTSKWVEFVSTSPLAEESGIVPGVAGLSIYTDVKRLLYMEADQECVVRINGDTSSRNRLEPWEAGNREQVAAFQKVGPVWSLSVLNRSQQNLNLLVVTAE